MRQSPSLGRRGFGSADVQAAVVLAGVGGDEFDWQVLGQLQGQDGFAGGGGSGDDEQRRS